MHATSRGRGAGLCWVAPDVPAARNRRAGATSARRISRHRGIIKGGRFGRLVHDDSDRVVAVHRLARCRHRASHGRHAGRPAGRRFSATPGEARETAGGYRVSGRWNFASGVTYADWLYCTCRLMDGSSPRMTAAGVPLTRAAWIPASAARIDDTWSVVGLRGTGSHDFIVDDIFVDKRHTSSFADLPLEAGQLYNPRTFFVTLWVVTAANALGIARGAIDTFVNLAGRSTTSAPLPLRDRPTVQSRVAEAEAILSAARAFVLDAVGTVWDGGPDQSLAIAKARLAITHAMHEAVRAVDLVFHAAGTNAIYSSNPLERHFRDIHVVVQHNAAFAVHYESAGKVLLGLRPTDPGW
jgi:alkylation response protein AidB-like acyl-CoA dehydrogenase